MSVRRALAALGVVATPAAASVVQPLSPAELTAGSDVVVEATVVDVTSRWTADQRNLESVIAIAGDDGARYQIVQPGGAVTGAYQEIVGMPRYRVGERARFHLVRRDDDAGWRVYGWAQGKWDQRVLAGVPVFLPGPRPDSAAFTTNGMVWPAARMPVPYLINTAGSDDLTLPEITATIHAAFQTWQDVPCAAITYQDAGPTDLGVAVDGQNAILFIESGWVYGAEAAGATALTILDGMQTADVAMNGQHFRWAIGPAGALAPQTLDLQGVLTHELGHWSGLGHTQRAHDTMYYSWTPWRGQRTPSADDQEGLCSIYPVAGDACASDGTGCPTGQACVTTPRGRLCDTAIDPVGTPCNYDLVECGDFCLFTAANLSTGYCSRFCDTDADCPPTHHCAAASAGGMPVKVCFVGPPAAPPDAAGSCAIDDHCPNGEYCSTMSACTLDCRGDDDCPRDERCDERGRCVVAAAPPDDGGCCSHQRRPDAAAALLIAAALVRPRRRRR